MHRIRKMTIAPLAALLMLSAAAAPSAGTSLAEVASFSTLAPKAMTLGKLLANPLLPALLLSTMQQNLASTYGRIRSDKPLYWILSDGDGGQDIPVLPIVDGIAQFTLNNPGSLRSDDGTVHLLTTHERPNEMFAAFDSVDGYVAFATTAAAAKQALISTASARMAPPALDAPIARIRLGEKSFAMFSAASASAETNSVDVAGMTAAIEASMQLDDKGLYVDATFQPKPGVAPADLRAGIEKTIGASLAALGKEDGVNPVSHFTANAKEVKAHISLPAAEMAKAGKAFNSAVVKALAPNSNAEKKASK